MGLRKVYQARCWAFPGGSDAMALTMSSASLQSRHTRACLCVSVQKFHT